MEEQAAFVTARHPRNISDPLERATAALLDDLGVPFIHESEGDHLTRRLDFYVPDFGVYVECKAMSTPRSAEQLERADDVILLQGRGAIAMLRNLAAETERLRADYARLSESFVELEAERTALRTGPRLDWIKPQQDMPEENETVLVLSSAVGIVQDVACYLGRDKGGQHRWLMTDIELDPGSIIAWARTPLPAWLDDVPT